MAAAIPQFKRVSADLANSSSVQSIEFHAGLFSGYGRTTTRRKQETAGDKTRAADIDPTAVCCRTEAFSGLLARSPSGSWNLPMAT